MRTIPYPPRRPRWGRGTGGNEAAWSTNGGAREINAGPRPSVPKSARRHTCAAVPGPDEASAEPDTEVINAVRPGMSTIPEAMLLCASSPYARKGALWNAYRRHFGRDGDEVLVWQADTRSMNPMVPQSYIDSWRKTPRGRRPNMAPNSGPTSRGLFRRR
jgi:hypothetical protein